MVGFIRALWHDDGTTRVSAAILPICAASLIVFAVLLAVPATVSAQLDPAPPRSLTALRVDESAIDIDGRLLEAVWSEAQFSDGFTQRDPSRPRRP